MDYIKIIIEAPEGQLTAYQEIDATGQVVLYKDALGQPLYAAIPAGIGSFVTDANPARESWML
jgi:hypothetical protein